METLKTILTDAPAASSPSPSYPAAFGTNVVPRSGGDVGLPPSPNLVTLQPLTQFPADIVVAPGATVSVPIQQLVGSRCVGFTIQGITAAVLVSINGGGFRTFSQNFTIDGAQITALTVSGGTGGCLVQLLGV